RQLTLWILVCRLGVEVLAFLHALQGQRRACDRAALHQRLWPADLWVAYAKLPFELPRQRRRADFAQRVHERAGRPRNVLGLRKGVQRGLLVAKRNQARTFRSSKPSSALRRR